MLLADRLECNHVARLSAEGLSTNGAEGDEINEETKSLSEFYSKHYSENYHVINGNQEIEMIQEDILKIAKN